MSECSDKESKLQCPKCGGAMEEGFIPDAHYGGIGVTKWIRGEPVLHWSGSVKGPPVNFLGGLKDKDSIRTISSFRCDHCGFLENYAK